MMLELAGQFKKCLFIVYRVPVESVRHLVSPGIQLITKGEWAFLSIVVCRVEHVRPLGFSKRMGWDFNYVAYRLYVEAYTNQNSKISGLYFLRSDVDRPMLVTLGNTFTDFRFHSSHIQYVNINNRFECHIQDTENNSAKTSFTIEPQDKFQLNHDSCFSSIHEAREFLKYKTLGLSCDGAGKYLKITEVCRDELLWKESPIKIVNAKWPFLEDLNQNEIYLELAIEVAPIEYQWRIGRTEKLR